MYPVSLNILSDTCFLLSSWMHGIEFKGYLIELIDLHFEGK